MIAFRHADPRFPFLREDSSQHVGRWNGTGELTHYFCDTPDGAWAEFLRHEEIDGSTGPCHHPPCALGRRYRRCAIAGARSASRDTLGRARGLAGMPAVGTRTPGRRRGYRRAFSRVATGRRARVAGRRRAPSRPRARRQGLCAVRSLPRSGWLGRDCRRPPRRRNIGGGAALLMEPSDSYGHDDR